MKEFVVLCVSAFAVGWIIYALAKSKATRTGTILLLVLWMLAVVGLGRAVLDFLAWVGV